MKFGKLICDARDLSMPEWRSKWMDYKALKTILKAIPMKPETVGSDELANQLSSSPTEVSFFTLLKEELKKVSEFYLSSESSMLESYKAMVSQLNAYKERLRSADESEAMGMLGSVVKFYMDLLLLENFAVINYCGFGKILKKHDKVTGYVTKEAYMQRMVNPQEFTHYPRLMRMLRYTEQSYQLLLHTYPSEARATLLSAESRLRLMQLEKVKAHSAAQKQSETSNQSRDNSTTPKSGAPARSFSAPSEGGSDTRQVGDDRDTHAEGIDVQSTLGGSASQVAAQTPAAAKADADSSREHRRVGDVELSAAQALVAVAADAEAQAAMPASTGAVQNYTGVHHSSGRGAHSAVQAPAGAAGPFLSGNSSSVTHGGGHYAQQPPPYAYMHAAHSSSHSHHGPHDVFSQGPSFSMPSVQSTHSAPRSVLSAHSQHSGTGGPMRPHPGHFVHSAPHGAPHMARHAMTRQVEPMHPAVAASAAARWRMEAQVGGPHARRYAPGVAPGQLRR